ncbi:MAG: cyclase [Chloroflexi bacterium]|nr:cyclase [Chloroflexota bacterium]
MGFVFFRTRVADYDSWKPVFDQDAADRKAAGSAGGQLFRDESDPNLVYILFEWDLDKARQYGQSETLANKMQEAGVVERPDIYFMNEVGKLSS